MQTLRQPFVDLSRLTSWIRSKRRQREEQHAAEVSKRLRELIAKEQSPSVSRTEELITQR